MTDTPPDIHVHVHLGGDSDTQAKLDQLGAQMTALTDAIDQMRARIDADFANVSDLLERALATDAADEAEKARLRQELADMQLSHTAEIDDAVARLGAVDPDPNFPEQPTPPDGGGGTPDDGGVTPDDGGGVTPPDGGGTEPVEPSPDEPVVNPDDETFGGRRGGRGRR
jgi:hypothetical protein